MTHDENQCDHNFPNMNSLYTLKPCGETQKVYYSKMQYSSQPIQQISTACWHKEAGTSRVG